MNFVVTTMLLLSLDRGGQDTVLGVLNAFLGIGKLYLFIEMYISGWELHKFITSIDF